MNGAELALLSLVAEGHQHGYEIQQAIDERGVREWASIGNSSVYYILNKLERDGLLSSQIEPSGRGPARKVYSLTNAGKTVLQTAVADLLSTPHDLGDGFVLGIANLHHLRPDQVRHALDAYEGKLRTRIAELNALRQEQTEAQTERSLQSLALFDYSLRMRLAELEWLLEFRQAWEAQAPPAAPNPNAFGTPVIRMDPTTQLPSTETLRRPRRADPPQDEED
jgi:DNA-binding PadR family transcriptional regulator